MRRYMYGVTDYEWSKWTGADLSDEEKQTAATIADGLKTEADFQKWLETNTDQPMKIRFAVQYATQNRKGSMSLPIVDFGKNVDSLTKNIKNLDLTAQKQTSETPWLLYAAGAAVLFLLFKNK